MTASLFKYNRFFNKPQKTIMIGRIKGIKVDDLSIFKTLKNAEFYIINGVIGVKPEFIKIVSEIHFDENELTIDDDVIDISQISVPVLEIDTNRITESAKTKIEKLNHLFLNILNSNSDVIHIPMGEKWVEKLRPKHLGELVHFNIESELNSEDFGKGKFKDFYNYDDSDED